jgi:Cof subfamily protein (haloacid dehalogenase superfamily)
VNRLFVSDLDGTLVDRRARLSAYTRRHLLELLGAGLPFTVASARSIYTIAPILEGVALELPIVEFNGAFITDLKTREALVCHALRPDVAARVMDWALEIEVPPFVCSYVNRSQRLTPPLVLANAGIAWYEASRRDARDPRLRAAADPRGLLEEPIVCLTLVAERARLEPIEAAILAEFPGQTHSVLYENRYQPGWYWLTVQSHLASKAHAVEHLARLAGVDLATVTVFGDEINDVPMFEVAGRAVAVENAVDELKRIAHEVIGPHDQDSVVNYLRASSA